MSSAVLKNKINKSLETMDEDHLKSAYIILKEFANQQKHGGLKVNHLVDAKIIQGIQQLDNNEGTDFKQFLNDMHQAYGKKK